MAYVTLPQNNSLASITGSRQGLAMLMASAVVVLKHETLTPSQSHNYMSIDFKFCVGDYVPKFTNPAILVQIQLAVATPGAA